MAQLDCVIVGQGICGSLLAYALHQKGKKVLIFDQGTFLSATHVAAGLLSPISGKRLSQNQNYEAAILKAKTFYTDIEKNLHISFFYSIQEYRAFQNNEEKAYYQKRLKNQDYAPFLGQDSFFLGQEGVWINGSHRLDTAVFLHHMTAYFKQHALIEKAKVKYEEFKPQAGYITYHGIKTKTVVFCEGFSVKDNPFVKGIEYRMAKGDVLTFYTPHWNSDVVFNQGKWIVPIGHHHYKCGATYEWEKLNPIPAKTNYEELIGFLDTLNLTYHVTQVSSGVRSITHNNQPIVGAVAPQFYALNGMGSKGLLWAPYYVSLLMETLPI